MTVKDFLALKEKIETAKTNKARAEGVKAKIEEEIKAEYDIGMDQIEDKISELKNELTSLDENKNKLVEKLEALCNWEDI